MSTQVSSFWWRWMVAATLFAGAFGLALVFAPHAMQNIFNTYYIPGVTLSADATQYASFLYGVMGAILFGWMVQFLFIVWGPFRRGEGSAWTMLATSIVLWYIVDSGVSIYTGFAINAGLNTVFLILFAVPLGATYRSFFAAPRSENPAAVH